MELVILVVVVGLLYGAYNLGHSFAFDEFRKRQNEVIPENMKMYSDFHRIFGYRGFFLSNLNSQIEGPLVVISTKDLTRLAAYKELGGNCDDQVIEERAKNISYKWLKEIKGYKDEDLIALDQLTKDGDI
jgi:hypothetical protein